MPLILEVLPIQLRRPPVYFASSFAHPRLKDCGFDTFWTSHDEAAKHGYRAYATWVYDAAAPSFKGKRIGWPNCIVFW